LKSSCGETQTPREGEEARPKKSRYSEEQMAMALRQVEAGAPVAEVCPKMQVTESTFFRWKKVYGHLGIAELRRLKQLEAENHKLKQLQQTLDAWRADCNNVRPHSGSANEPPVRDRGGGRRILTGERLLS
jgi:putative transposase